MGGARCEEEFKGTEDGHSGEDDWMRHGDWTNAKDGEMGYGGRDYDQEEQGVGGSDQWEDERVLGGFDDDDEEEAVLAVQRKRKLVTSGMKFPLIHFFSLWPRVH